MPRYGNERDTVLKDKHLCTSEACSPTSADPTSGLSWFLTPTQKPDISTLTFPSSAYLLLKVQALLPWSSLTIPQLNPLPCSGSNAFTLDTEAWSGDSVPQKQILNVFIFFMEQFYKADTQFLQAQDTILS